MQAAAIPAYETERLATLRGLDILDTGAEPEFDELVTLAASLCKTPISTVSLIDENRQWLKAAVGIPRNECRRGVAFCAHAILGENVFVVEDAMADDRFADNPLVLGRPDIRFYAGIPVATANNLPLGTLCVIDTVPRQLSPEQKQALEILGRQVNVRLELRMQRKTVRETQAENRKLRDTLQQTQRQLEQARQQLSAATARN